MMSSKKEVEIKFPILNGEDVIKKLNQVADFKYEAHQVDKYFNPPHRDFTKDPDGIIYEWLRLRHSDRGDSVNYKNWRPRTHCDEYESSISSLEDMELLLNALDIKPLITVDKVRKAWLYKDIEISMDIEKELGYFIELEHKGNIDNIDKARQELFSMLEELGAKTGEEDNRGYPYNLLIKKGLYVPQN
jgi:adenylate cyclase class 2